MIGVIVGGWEYVIAVYVLSGVVISGLILWTVLDYRSQRHALSELEALGITRRSSVPSAFLSGEED
ncbi:MAG: heme exporter protein CcmD [Alphaproteobacteria bacterium]|nr:heme exporter protein CcmD [Alphaproteobacteria bacterium]